MRNGMSGASIPFDLLYAGPINTATLQEPFSPLVAYAIAEVETIEGERAGLWTASTIVSKDGGHGLFQLTSSYPAEWANPYQNALYALRNFLIPSESRWASAPYNMQGGALIRCIAAEFNAGFGNWYGPNHPENDGAYGGHMDGDVGLYTTHEDGVSYSDHALKNYNALLDLIEAQSHSA